MRRETVVQALAELERVLPTLAGVERARLARVEARLRAVLAGRCNTADGCIGCPGQCHIERAFAQGADAVPSAAIPGEADTAAA